MFNAEKIKNECVEWIRDFFDNNGKDCNAVLGISGGKDSSIVAALCVAALGKDRVVGILMPNGEQCDIADSRQLVEHLGIRNYTSNIKDAYDNTLASIKAAGLEPSNQAIINLAPRLRMTTLYAFSQTLNGRVVNTCNLSEDWIGYSTRYGDSAGDFGPIAGITVEEVLQVGEYLGLPENLVHKVPSDGLSGMSDEDKIGFTYAVLDKYIRTGVCEDEETKAKIDRMNKMNAFKLKPLPFYKPDESLL